MVKYLSKKKTGRPTKASNDVLNTISKLTVEKRTISANQLSLNIKKICGVDISPTSINRYRTNSLNFNYLPPKVKQELTNPQIQSRILFSNSFLQSKINLSSIVFSDESRFCLNNDGNMRWYRKNENSDDVYDKRSKYSPGIMVFGAIGYNYKSKLVICEKNIDEVEYRNVLNNSEIFTELKENFINGESIFMQDGAPAHTGYCSNLFLKKRCSYIKYWPANSPDLNPIEHLWGAIKRILKGQIFTNKIDLIQKVQEIWYSFPQEKINELVLSFETRLKLVIQERGQSITNILRTSIHQNPEFNFDTNLQLLTEDDLIEKFDDSVDDCPLEFVSKRKFTDDEDMRLLYLIKIYGTQWKVLTRFFEQRTPTSLRIRYRKIRGL